MKWGYGKTLNTNSTQMEKKKITRSYYLSKDSHYDLRSLELSLLMRLEIAMFNTQRIIFFL